MKVLFVLIMWAVMGGCGLHLDTIPNYTPEELRQQLVMGLSQLDKKELLEQELKNIIQSKGKNLKNSSKCQIVMQLHTILNPDTAHAPWFQEGHCEIEGLFPALPAHVVIRFGTHRSYGYALMFDAQYDFPASLELEHIDGYVYFSTINQ